MAPTRIRLGMIKEVLRTFLRKNWFKLGLGSILLGFTLQDSVALKINLKPVDSPAGQPTAVMEHQPPVEEDKFTLQSLLPDWTRGSGEEQTRRNGTSALDRLSVLDPVEIDAFIKRFAHVALTEQEKYGVPASITIANALLLSTANRVALSREDNNYFRLPCTADQGESEVVYEGRCYREFETAWASFRAHSRLLQSWNLEGSAPLGPTDYPAWARLVDRRHLHGEKKYARQLIDLIEDLELYYLDVSS